MGSKVINVGNLSALPLLMEVLEAQDGRALLTDRLIADLSTTGSGDFADVADLSYLIHELISYALFVNAQEYDLEKAAAALIAANSGE
jgi:hypothetical protein